MLLEYTGKGKNEVLYETCRSGVFGNEKKKSRHVLGISLKTKPRMLGTVIAFRINMGKGRNALSTTACFKLYACQLNNFKNDFVCYILNFGKLTMLYII